ncbi:MAG: polysaccharide deacetylase family protein [Bryobacterales bacterium]|nr:polysaccharide deacetylase family protein [Bryobacterales bacterium]MBV9401766.1 polysaccharide deacetylase family protein [Bryobacterales bacterium]
MVRNRLKTGAAHLLYRTGLYKFIGSLNGTKNLPVVIGYHRVVEDFAASLRTSIPSMLVSRQMFERHLDWIGRRYRVVGLEELGARMEAGEQLPPRTAAITFDDGYADFYEQALPVLQRKGFPAAVFVVTGLAGTNRIPDHDRLYLLLTRRIGRRTLPIGQGMWVQGIDQMTPYQATRILIESLPSSAISQVIETLEKEDELPEADLKPFRLLDWDQLQKIKRAGVTIGSHTQSHIVLTNETAMRVTEELAGSRAELEHKLGGTFRHFVYPSGLFTMNAVKQVADAGYKFAYIGCTHRSPEYPLLTLPRTVLWERSSLNSDYAFSGSVLSCQIHHALSIGGTCRQQHSAVN